jgi:hypothetical protein
VTTEVVQTPAPDHLLVRVGLQAPVSMGIPPGNLVFLIDVRFNDSPDKLLRSALALARGL